MGIDAEMFVRYRGAKPTEEQLKLWGWDLGRAVGASNFFIRPEEGRGALYLSRVYDDAGERDGERAGKEWHQDGETLHAEADEWFIQPSLVTRYYGVGYERGNWQVLVHVAEWLEQNIGGEVWYGGDSSGVEAKLFDAQSRAELVAHALSENGRDYYGGFERNAFKTPAPCSLCVKGRGMTRHGWGPAYIAVSCGGCGKSFETRDDGKTWQETKQD